MRSSRGTLEFSLAGSRQDATKAEAKRARRLSPFVNLDGDDVDAGPSQWRGGDDQDCNSWAAKAEPPSDDDSGDYDVFYQRLDMQ
jgi:hypothetical protein